jgi:DNA-binding beta-propeller fold protein YncE
MKHKTLWRQNMDMKLKYLLGKLTLLPYLAIMLISLVYNGCMRDREPTAPSPLTRPVMTNNSKPANAELNVPVNSSIKIYFTEKMDVNTLPNRLIVKDNNGETIQGTYSVQDTTAIFTPVAELKKSTIYRVTLKGRLRDIYRNSISFNGYPVYDDTTIIYSDWFFTEGKYSENGFNPIYIADKSNIYLFGKLDSIYSTIAYSPAIISGAAVTPDGSYLLVSIEAKNQVDFINLKTNTLETSVTVSGNPQSIAVINDYAYVVCVNGKAIEKIKISTKVIEATLGLSFYPGKIAISNDGNTLFTLDQSTKDLVILDASNGTVTNTVKNAYTLPASGELKTDETNRLFICDTKGYKLSVATAGASFNDLGAAYSFPSKVSPVNIDFDENYLYAAAGNSIYKLDKQTFALINQITFTTAVKSLTIIPSKDLLYAITSTSCIVIDLNSFSRIKEIVPGGANLQIIIGSSQKF